MTEIDGTVKEVDIKKCCHCGGYWDKKPGSGIERGFCLRCMDEFCGPNCAACTPHEKWLQKEAEKVNEFVKVEGDKWLEKIYKNIVNGITNR